MDAGPDRNKLADPAEPQMPSPQEMAQMAARQWWNGLAGMPPGEVMNMLRMMGQQGPPPGIPGGMQGGMPEQQGMMGMPGMMGQRGG